MMRSRPAAIAIAAIRRLAPLALCAPLLLCALPANAALFGGRRGAPIEILPANYKAYPPRHRIFFHGTGPGYFVYGRGSHYGHYVHGAWVWVHGVPPRYAKRQAGRRLAPCAQIKQRAMQSGRRHAWRRYRACLAG